MNIRAIRSSALLLVLSNSLFAEDVRARLFSKDGSNIDVLIIHHKKGEVLYHLTKVDLNKKKIKASSLDGIYFYEPKVYTKAMKLFVERKYSEAKKLFAKCEQDFKNVASAKGNYATLAGFYKLECNRLMFDFATLNSEQEKFGSKALAAESHTQQLELNSLWQAVRLKDWERLDKLGQKWGERSLRGDQLVQVAYCHALAKEQLAGKDPEKIREAILLYHKAMVADYTTSIEIVTQSAQNVLNIYLKDESVQTAIKLWETDDENKNSAGYSKLQEANSLAKLYKMAGFGRITPLPSELAKFINYEDKEAAEEALRVAKINAEAEEAKKGK